MNDQVAVIMRYALTAITSYGVAKGWFTPEQASNLAANLLNLVAAAVPVGMTVWAMLRSTKTAKVSDVQAMPDMQVVTTSQATKDAVPDVKLASPASATVTVAVPKSAA